MTILAIDLGTTNSLCAVYTEDGPKLIPNSLGEYLTPSVVAVNGNGAVPSFAETVPCRHL